jgi:hypothetical protein
LLFSVNITAKPFLELIIVNLPSVINLQFAGFQITSLGFKKFMRLRATALAE